MERRLGNATMASIMLLILGPIEPAEIDLVQDTLLLVRPTDVDVRIDFLDRNSCRLRKRLSK